jgi:hypothetical protein
MRVIVDTTDPRLSPTERQVLRNVAEKLQQPPRQPLPPAYAEEIERVYGDHYGGDRDRWQIGEEKN